MLAFKDLSLFLQDTDGYDKSLFGFIKPLVMVWSNQGVAKKGSLYKATCPETVGIVLFEATCCGGGVIFGLFVFLTLVQSLLFILFFSGNVFFSFFVEQNHHFWFISCWISSFLNLVVTMSPKWSHWTEILHLMGLCEIEYVNSPFYLLLGIIEREVCL